MKQNVETALKAGILFLVQQMLNDVNLNEWDTLYGITLGVVGGLDEDRAPITAPITVRTTISKTFSGTCDDIEQMVSQCIQEVEASPQEPVRRMCDA